MFCLINVLLYCVFVQLELAEICAKCERYIGTEGGGMDQSISFLAEKGTVRPFPFFTSHQICERTYKYIQICICFLWFVVVVLKLVSQAKLIEFQPLRATDVKLPDGAVFVISNCCVEMNKAASSHFNIRVVECRIATKVL